MSKVTLNHMFISASGKLCKKESTYIAYSKKTGKMYSAEYHEREYPDSEKQQAVKTAFTTKSKAASAWYNANKPIVDEDGNVTREATDAYNLLLEKFNAQRKYASAYMLLRTLVGDDGTVNLGSTTTTTPSSDASSTTPSDNAGDGA